jgi:hypothetical protein
MKIKISSTISETVTVIFIILFLYTGIDKIMDHLVFKEQIAESPILAPVASFAVILLPFFELTTVLLLVVPRFRLKGLYVALCLMLLFTGYIGAILCFDKHLPCSCGGLISQLSWKQHLLFNSICIALNLVGIYAEKRVSETKRKTLLTIIANDYAH